MQNNSHDRNLWFKQFAEEFGFDPTEPLRIGGKYESAVIHGDTLYLSGQVPRIGTSVAVTGRVGAETSLAEAQRAAKICVLRCLTILQQTLGDLHRVKKILKLNVYVQSNENFTQQSEVADAASDILYAVFAPEGGHTRTSVGVTQLPKNAAVELDLIVALHPSL